MKKNWKSWLFLAIPYLMTALIPVISVLFLGNTILKNYEEKLISDKQHTLQVAEDRLQQKSDTIEQLAVMLGSSDVLTQYSSACLNRSGHTTLDFMDVKKLLSNAISDPVIHDIFIYDKKDEAAISASSALKSMEVFFRYYYIVEGLSLEESMARLDNPANAHSYSPEISITVPTSPRSSKRVLEYRMFLPIGWVRDMQCQLVMVLDAEELFKDFRDALPTGGEFYVYDSNNVLIFQHGSLYQDLIPLTDSEALHPMQHEGAQIHSAVLRSGSWKVKVFIPDLVESSSPLSFLSPAFSLFVILPMIACLLLAITLTHKNYRRILELVNLFRSHSGEAPKEPEIVDYRLVQRYVSQVIAEKNQMTQQISQYSDSRKYEVLDKLVRNTYNSREEAAHALEEANLVIGEGRNIVLCIRCPEVSYETILAEGITVRETVRQIFGELLEQPYVLFDTATNETTCIISLEEGEDTDILVQAIISQLNVELAYRYNIEVNIGVGNPAPSAFSLHESYAQARRVLQYREAFGIKVTLYADLQQLEDAYYYPREYSERISNYIIAGRQNDAMHLIRQVYEENFENPEKHLSENAIGKLKQQLWDCIHSLADKYSFSLEGRLSTEIAAKPFFDALVQCVDLLSNEIQQKQKQVRHKTASRLLDYIHENFCDNKLSLKQISETFGMHESYISNVFKNALGENLSVYIERLRIEKARDMVKNTDLKIQEIANLVGYTSDASFRRAFKKITGVSPVEYREQ